MAVSEGLLGRFGRFGFGLVPAAERGEGIEGGVDLVLPLVAAMDADGPHHMVALLKLPEQPLLSRPSLVVHRIVAGGADGQSQGRRVRRLLRKGLPCEGYDDGSGEQDPRHQSFPVGASHIPTGLHAAVFRQGEYPNRGKWLRGRIGSEVQGRQGVRKYS